MRKIVIFLILTILALVSLVAITIVGFYVLTSSPYPAGWIDQMGSMMAGESSSHMQAQNSLAPYFGLVFVVLVGIAIFGIGGMAYFFVLPELRTTNHAKLTLSSGDGSFLSSKGSVENQLTPYDAVLRTLTANERKVVEVLKAHNGRYLQKYIRNDTGLSRLQTHRVVAHLVQTGIISAEQSGNTNVITLEPWLKPAET